MGEDKEKTFYDKVYEVARMVPYGRVTSYGAIAKYLGTGLSARMVGWALNSCAHAEPPVPAHRVVNRIGLLTGKIHFPTPTLMQEILESEGIEIFEDKVVKFKELYWNPMLELPDNLQ